MDIFNKNDNFNNDDNDTIDNTMDYNVIKTFSEEDNSNTVHNLKKNRNYNFLYLLIGFLISTIIFMSVWIYKTYQKNESENIIEENVQTEIVYRENNDVSDIVASAMNSIVSITSTTTYEQFNFLTGYQAYNIPSSGSGIIVGKTDSTLYIATNNHVVEDSTELTIEFSDGTSAPAIINGTSNTTDIAVITVELNDINTETLNKIKVASLHTEDDLKVGNQVIAIGNALGYGQSVTVGYISALDRNIQTENGEVSGLIQTDAAINPGNSGGALLNMNGEVIGINVAKYSSTEVEGIGYSIPISQIQDLLNMLSKEKVDEKEQGSLGIQCTSIDASISQMYGMPQGAFVYKIMNEDLNNVGLLEKDIIVSLDGYSITDANSLIDILEYYKVGDTVELSIKRIENGDYVDKTISVKLISKNSL